MKRFQSKLKGMPVIVKASAQAVVKNSAEQMRYKAQKYSPVDTWFMHDNIFTFHSSTESETHSTAPYSGYVNDGTRFQYAQPFFSTAFEEVEKEFNKNMEDVIKRRLSL